MVVFAINISSGGGKVLLDEIIENQTLGTISHCFIDKRYTPPTGAYTQKIQFIRVKPNLFNRWKAELDLLKLTNRKTAHLVICFGNLPPFLPHSTKVITYLQNALLLPRSRFPRDGIQPFLRNIYERLIWILFGKNTDEIWVQTPWMKEHLKATTDYKVEVKPIFPTLTLSKNLNTSPEFDYVMVTGPESHKHVKEFLDLLLQSKLTDLSLHLIINLGKKNTPLKEKVCECMKRWQSFKLSTGLSRQEVLEAYQKAGTLINTSTIESFCLPIYEARALDLKVKCLNRPFNKHIKKGLEKFETIEDLVKSL